MMSMFHEGDCYFCADDKFLTEESIQPVDWDIEERNAELDEGNALVEELMRPLPLRNGQIKKSYQLKPKLTSHLKTDNSMEDFKSSSKNSDEVAVKNGPISHREDQSLVERVLTTMQD